MGFERNRFIDLDESLAEELLCSICLNIFEIPITCDDCDHTFCKQCIRKAIEEKNIKNCPFCRTQFSRKRTNENQKNLVLIQRFVFKLNRNLNNIIDKRRVKCDNESKGCKQTFELSSFKTHLKVCPFGKCNACERRPKGAIDDHNCIESLKNDKIELKLINDSIKDKNSKLENKINLLENERKALNQKFVALKEESNEFRAQNLKIIEYFNGLNDKNTKLEEEIKRLTQNKISSFYSNQTKRPFLLRIAKSHFKCNHVHFGEHKNSIKWKMIFKYSDVILFCKKPYNLSINTKIQELMYCLDTNHSVLIISTDSDSCSRIRRSLLIDKEMFDIDSNDLSKRFVFIETIPHFIEILISMANEFMSSVPKTIDSKTIEKIQRNSKLNQN